MTNVAYRARLQAKLDVEYATFVAGIREARRKVMREALKAKLVTNPTMSEYHKLDFMERCYAAMPLPEANEELLALFRSQLTEAGF